MGSWVEDNSEVIVSLAVVVLGLVLVCVLAWRYRGDRKTPSTTNDMLIGYGIGFVLVITFQIVRLLTFGSPESSAGVLASNFVPLFFTFAVALIVAHRRYLRRVKRNDGEVQAAKGAIPQAARDYFAAGDFPSRAGEALSASTTPAPDAATDLVSFWTFAALDSGDYVDYSRTVHYTTMVRGWRLSSPTLVEAIPVLAAPFVRSGDDEWDPDVDRAFRRTALALLTARFGTPVAA